MSRAIILNSFYFPFNTSSFIKKTVINFPAKMFVFMGAQEADLSRSNQSQLLNEQSIKPQIPFLDYPTTPDFPQPALNEMKFAINLIFWLFFFFAVRKAKEEHFRKLVLFSSIFIKTYRVKNSLVSQYIFEPITVMLIYYMSRFQLTQCMACWHKCRIVHYCYLTIFCL